jgi:hypothetical protein
MPRVARVVVNGVPHYISQQGNNLQDESSWSTKTGDITKKFRATNVGGTASQKRNTGCG